MLVQSRDVAQLALEGYAVIPQFLNDGEISALKEDFTVAPAQVVPAKKGASPRTKPYGVKHVGDRALHRTDPKLFQIGQLMSSVIGAALGLRVAAFYFDTRVANFDMFHQDLEPYWLFQDPRQYINVYVPFIKPDTEKSNVEVLPCDTVAGLLPQISDGPNDIMASEGTARIQNLSTGKVIPWNVDLRQIAKCPRLNAGDALLMRGDTFHRTQDSDTVRVAASFRLTNPRHLLAYSKFLDGGVRKLRAIAESRRMLKAVSCFIRQGHELLSAEEVYRAATDSTEPMSAAVDAIASALRKAEAHQAGAG